MIQETRLNPSRPNEVMALGWSPDGILLATGGSDTTMKVWEVATMEHTEERWDEDEGWDGDTELRRTNVDDILMFFAMAERGSPKWLQQSF